MNTFKQSVIEILKKAETPSCYTKITRLALESGILGRDDINSVQSKTKFVAFYVKQEEYEKYKPSNFEQLVKNFGE